MARDLPAEFGAWNTARRRFSRRARAGVWRRPFEALADDPDFEHVVLLGATIVRAHRHAAGGAQGGAPARAIGRPRGGPTTKRPIAVDAPGNPVRVRLTPGRRHEAPQADALVEGSAAGWAIADTAFDADPFRGRLPERGAGAVIPADRSRSEPIAHDEHPHKGRHLVEGFINEPERSRRIATRHEKTARHLLAMIHLACAMVWLR